ncbi:MAG: TonB-dependent receptor [Brumimicrobium sp.]
MIYIKKVLFLFCLFISVNALGQTLSVISLNDNLPVPFARLDIVFEDETFNFKTDENGEWKVEEKFKTKPIDLKIINYSYDTKEIKNIVLSKDTTVALYSDVREFKEVAITAQYKTVLIENAVHNIKVVDRQKIQDMAAQNVKDVLTNELNIRISEDQVLGSAMKLQGIGGENVKILVDDVPLTGRLNGNIDLSQIPVDNIERIEIVEGPLSVSYGTDALAGTINIITKKNQSSRFEGTSNNYFESSGKVNNTVSLGLQLKKHQIRIEGGRHFFDGWDPSHKTFHFNPNPIADTSRVQLWNPKVQYFAGLNYRYNRKNFVLNYSSQFFNEDILNRGMPRKPAEETAFDDYYNTKRINQRLFFEYRFKNEYRLNIIAAYNGYLRRKNTKIRDLTEIRDVLSSDPNDHDTSQYHSIISRGRMIQAKPNKKFNYELGYDILHEFALGNRIENNKKSIGDYALFVSAEYSPIEKITIRPGLRYSYNTEYKAPLTPSLNVKYSFFENEKNLFNLRASYARGFRSPSIKELHYTFIDINHNIVGNPDLRAEFSNNYNLSFYHDLKMDKIRLRSKISGFYSDIKNLITLALKEGSMTEYSYLNLERFSSTGIQVETSLSYKNISSTLGFSYIGIDNHLTHKGEIEKTGFKFSPETVFNLTYYWQKTGLRFALFYKYTGKLPMIYRDSDGLIYESTVGDYHTADLTLSKSFWKDRVQLTAGVKNIFDVKTIPGSEKGTDVTQIAHSTSSSGVNIGIGRTYNLGIKLYFKSK